VPGGSARGPLRGAPRGSGGRCRRCAGGVVFLLVAVAVLGGVAVRLLLFPGASVGRLRLAAAVADRSAVRGRRAGLRGRAAGRAGVGAVLCAPAVALWAVAGAGPALLLGVPAGAARYRGPPRRAG